MNVDTLRKKFIDFFKKHNHKQISSASLIPQNDPTVLFTTAGMHPLVPYLLGEKHPEGTRLVNFQKCIRTGDIEAVGDKTHLTLFEMLGNWSLGDYFKEESIEFSFEFLTKELNLPVERLYVSVFEGESENNIPKDEASAKKWQSLGIPKERIFYFSRAHNWWGPAGQTGPCGPDSEIFYDTNKPKCSVECDPSCSCGKYIEIWNNVFMQYNKLKDGTYAELNQKNIDTGMGLERILAVVTGESDVYKTQIFSDVIAKIEELSGKKYEDYKKDFRVIADHTRAATFILGDQTPTLPSNSEQGYVLRRLIRRLCRYFKRLDIEVGSSKVLSEIIIKNMQEVYPELAKNKDKILEEVVKEEFAFEKTLKHGLKIFNKMIEGQNYTTLPGELAFKLYDTYGFPIEFTIELCEEKGIKVDLLDFKERFENHQQLSRQGSHQLFKGGLSDHSEQTTKLHTATHLLHQALRLELGEGVKQKGSNINAERLRFDFSFDRKMTSEEIARVEDRVNEVIQKNLPVSYVEMPYEKAQAENAIGLFEHKYSEMVKVYSIGDFSKEICGGPHVKSTGELGKFKITQETSSSAGVRRIKASLI